MVKLTKIYTRTGDGGTTGLVDGSRVANWATRVVAGERRRYEYPRWQFTNNSADIRGLCCYALGLVDVAWRQSNWKTISVSRRADVARLDALIGPKR